MKYSIRIRPHRDRDHDITVTTLVPVRERQRAVLDVLDRRASTSRARRSAAVSKRRGRDLVLRIQHLRRESQRDVFAVEQQCARHRRDHQPDAPTSRCWQYVCVLHLHFLPAPVEIGAGPRSNPNRAASSAGRAPRSQCGGQEFDPPAVHQPSLLHSMRRLSRRSGVAAKADFHLPPTIRELRPGKPPSLRRRAEVAQTLTPIRMRIDSRTLAR